MNQRPIEDEQQPRHEAVGFLTRDVAEPASFDMTESQPLTPAQAEAVVRLLEAAPHVRRRYQFFVWTQSHLQALLPHDVLVCGAYLRQRRDLMHDAFYSVVLSPPTIEAITQGGGELLRLVGAAWVTGRGRPLAIDLSRLLGDTAQHEAAALRRETKADCVFVHGVSRPQRPAEIESLFVLIGGGRSHTAQRLQHFEMLIPHLHATWQRVQTFERDMKQAPAASAPARAAPASTRQTITERERQILAWVREGKSNLQIGELLGISPLTVKNHMQKVLRKLGASNRAQAVAQAIALRLLDGAIAHPTGDD